MGRHEQQQVQQNNQPNSLLNCHLPTKSSFKFTIGQKMQRGGGGGQLALAQQQKQHWSAGGCPQQHREFCSATTVAWRRSLLLLLLMAGAALDQVPSCLALDENNGIDKNDRSSPSFYDQQEEEADLASAGDKRAGGRAFMPFVVGTENEKRGGGRAFLPAAQKRAGARAFQSQGQLQPAAAATGLDLKKRDNINGANAFYFSPDEKKKRGGARPFFGSGFFGGDGTWKRGGGRFFFRPFADTGYGNGWVKRAGGRHFSMKRGGGRSFFGGMDSLFDPSNYWAPQRYTPIGKFPRRSLDPEEGIEEEQQQQQQIIPPFYYTNNHNFEGRANGKRGGARAFGDGNTMMDMNLLEKRGGGRMFIGNNAEATK